MKSYTPDELKAILAAHREWIDSKYTSGARADLSRADLSGADLSGAYLSRADLPGADLSGADLSGAYLSGADLSGAYLSGAYLSGAYLSRADLSGADLSGAYLSGAYLSQEINWHAYLAEVVPALLAAGGKAVDAVLDSGCFDCHAWENCPMHEAFNAPNLAAIPAPYRSEAARFIELFDAKAITVKAIREAMAAHAKGGRQAVSETDLLMTIAQRLNARYQTDLAISEAEARVLNKLWDWRAGMGGHPYYTVLGADMRDFVRGYK